MSKIRGGVGTRDTTRLPNYQFDHHDERNVHYSNTVAHKQKNNTANNNAFQRTTSMPAMTVAPPSAGNLSDISERSNEQTTTSRMMMSRPQQKTSSKDNLLLLEDSQPTSPDVTGDVTALKDNSDQRHVSIAPEALALPSGPGINRVPTPGHPSPQSVQQETSKKLDEKVG